MSWWLWILVGGLALVGESLTMALFLLYVGVAAFVVAVLAAVHVREGIQVSVFLALAVLLIGLVRPRMLHALGARVPRRALTNAGALAERSGVVTQTVTRDGGTIRVGAAEFWSARAAPPSTAIEMGHTVRIMYVDGLTAYVAPADDEGVRESDMSFLSEHAS